MEDKMSGGSGWRFAIGLVLVVALILGAAAIGYAAYSAGVAQGTAQSAGASVVAPRYAPYGPMGYPYPHFGFGFLGCLIPLFFLFVVCGLFRLVVHGGMRRPWHGGWSPKGFMHEGMRSEWLERAEEWHRKQHGEGGEGKT